VTKIHNRNKLQEEGFLWAHSFRRFHPCQFALLLLERKREDEREREREREREAGFNIPPVTSHLSKLSESPQLVPPVADQEFNMASLWGTFHSHDLEQREASQTVGEGLCAQGTITSKDTGVEQAKVTDGSEDNMLVQVLQEADPKTRVSVQGCNCGKDLGEKLRSEWEWCGETLQPRDAA
jgi:hypothetical protein